MRWDIISMEETKNLRNRVVESLEFRDKIIKLLLEIVKEDTDYLSPERLLSRRKQIGSLRRLIKYYKGDLNEI